MIVDMFRYLKSPTFKKYIPDWIIAIILSAYFFFIGEHARPFNRQFSLNDLTISHPFAVHERVSGIACILLATIIPLFVIFIASLKHYPSRHQFFHNLQISILGLVIALSLDGNLTDILKNWISRPRPDFLARCGPAEGTSRDILVDISVCTAPLGHAIFVDGMRSTPSGHSSISFSGFLYLTLWLCGQYKLFTKTHPLYKYLVSCSPLLLATYVALSRTQDYRHHFMDIFMGGCIGIFFAIVVYKRYFESIWSEDAGSPVDEEVESILPS